MIASQIKVYRMDKLSTPFDIQLDITVTEPTRSASYLPSLEDYWSALEIMDSQYEALQRARKDALWHQEQMTKANELCESENFAPINLTKVDQLQSGLLLSQDFSKNKMNSALTLLDKYLKGRSTTKREGDKEISKLKEESRNELQRLRGYLKELRSDFSSTSSQIEEIKKRIESLKTSKMLRVITLASVFFFMFLASKSMVMAAIVTALTFWFI